MQPHQVAHPMMHVIEKKLSVSYALSASRDITFSHTLLYQEPTPQHSTGPALLSLDNKLSLKIRLLPPTLLPAVTSQKP